MLSPIKAITTGALVFAIGGALFLAQPGVQYGESLAGADSADLVEPAGFTAAIEKAPNVAGTAATCEVVEGVNHCRDSRLPVQLVDVSDSRLDGQLTISSSQIQYLDHPWLVTDTFRIFKADGAWQGSGTRAGESMTVVLVGEGAYEGLYAWADVSDWSAISGVIYPDPPLEAIDLAVVTTE